MNVSTINRMQTSFGAKMPFKTNDMVVRMAKSEGKLPELSSVMTKLPEFGTTDTTIIYDPKSSMLCITHPNTPTKAILLKGNSILEQVLHIDKATIEGAERELTEGKGVDLYY